MSGAPIFPAEIWLNIIDYIRGPEIVGLSLLSSRLCDLCYERLENLKHLHTKYRCYDETEVYGVEISPYHELLAVILRGEILPCYVVELICNQSVRLLDDLGFKPGEKPAERFDEADLARFKEAVYTSPWIKEDEAARCYNNLIEGDEDSALAVLLPLLEGLRTFCPPVDVELTFLVVGRIAAATSPLSSTRIEGIKPPLANLLQIETSISGDRNCGGLLIEDVASLASLPSIKRVIVEGLDTGRDFHWPENLPQSRVREFYFPLSACTAQAARGFSKGIAGPCMMRHQYWHFRSSGWEHDENWDHLEIMGEIDPVTGLIKEGTRREILTLRGDGYVRTHWAGPEEKRLSVGMDLFDDYTKGSWKNLL